MSLLRDIQTAAVDPNTDVSTLLRKCKILAVRLGNNEFKKWVDNELNGYEKADDLPEYRVLHTESYGHFCGSFGRQLNRAPIPPSCLPKELRDRVTKSYLTSSISSYAALVNTEKRNNAHEPWPADMVAYYGRHIYEDMNCLSAWKIIPHNALIGLIETYITKAVTTSCGLQSPPRCSSHMTPR